MPLTTAPLPRREDLSSHGRLGGEQIITDEQFMDFTHRGIYIDPWPTNNTVIITTLVVSEQAWQTDKEPIPVQCVAIDRGRLNNPKRPPEPYFVIFYGESECCWRHGYSDTIYTVKTKVGRSHHFVSHSTPNGQLV